MATIINAKDLTKKEDPLKQTTPLVDPILTAGTGIIDGAVASIEANQLAVTTAQKDTQAKLDKIASDNALLLGKTGDTAVANENAGVNLEKANLDKFNIQLNDISGNISSLATEAKAIPLQIQEQFKNSGATDRGVAPIQAGDLRKNAIKALTQSALADVVTANISNSTIRLASAKEKAQQIVDLKYSPIEQEIAQLKDQLSLNKLYITDPAEKKLLESQNKILDERTRLLGEKKEKDTSFLNTINSGITNGNVDATKGYQILSDYNSGKITIADAYKKLGLTTDYTTSPTKSLAGAISAVESAGSGDYLAVGKKMTSGAGKGYSALGKYQIMPNFWFDDIGLDANSASDRESFLNSPAQQDELFNHIISTLTEKNNGSIPKAVAEYFGGSAGAKAYGTPAGDKITDGNLSVNQYVNKVLGKLNGANPTVEQYGLLANTTFDTNNPKDKNAQQYISNYIKNATLPTAISLGISTRSSKPAQAKQFQEITQRANDLYFEATGQSLPDVQVLKENKKLVTKNNNILNNNMLASKALEANFQTAIDGEITNNVNKNATIVNRILNPIYLALGDPAVNQALVSNGTITQEFANLISIRNAQGTTVADKEMANELIRFGTSVEAQKAVVERLKTEAINIQSAIRSTNDELWKQIDPLIQDPNNPLRKGLIGDKSAVSNGVDLSKFFKKQ